MEGEEEQKRIRRKEFTDHKVSIPGFNLVFVFLILSILWAKQHPSEKTMILPHCAQTPVHSNHITLRKTTQFVFIQMGKICLIGNRCTSFSPMKFGGSGDMDKEITCEKREMYFENALEIIREKRGHSMLNSSFCIYCTQEKLVGPRSHRS